MNSAGINVTARSWAEVGVAAWRQIVDVNLTGTFHCMHAVKQQYVSEKQMMTVVPRSEMVKGCVFEKDQFPWAR